MHLPSLLRRLPPLLRNFYFVTSVLFAVWLLFFDQNDLLSRYRQQAKIRELRDQQHYYEEKIEEVREDRNELMTDPARLEKYARERYFMKRPGEDVYVIVEEE
ncbi:MAG: septum formation initiator family protein [Catalinimonas sp.]